jgi:PTS system N-acetylgalactosamine-specific IIA component
MIGIILTGHGEFASGLEKNVRMLAGTDANISAIDFEDGMSVEQLDDKLKSAFEAKKDSSCILVFCDIAGGTPYKRAAAISDEWPKARVISGTNVPMLLEIAMHNDGDEENTDVDEIADELIFAGTNSIMKY